MEIIRERRNKGKPGREEGRNKRNNKESQSVNERQKISHYHGKIEIIQRDMFVSGQISKMYLLWSIYPQPRIRQEFTATCIYKSEIWR